MRILILEDDPLIALDLRMLVEDQGHAVVGPCCSVRDAGRHVGAKLDFALLDIDLPDGKSFDLAVRFAAEGVPFAFVSASRPADLPGHLRHSRFIPKPYVHSAILNVLPSAARLAS